MSILRRLTALLVALLLAQANWQESGAACLAVHAASHDGPGAAAAMTARAEAGVQVASASAGHGTTHDGMTTMPPAPKELGEVSAVAPPTQTGNGEQMPTHCPDSAVPAVPAGCAAMTACSAAAVSPIAGALLATEGDPPGERVAEPDIRPESRDAAPDVPPPRA